MLENGFYNMDCMEGMKDYPDNHFDLAIVDPPYGIGEDGGNNHTRRALAISQSYKSYTGGDIAPNTEYFDELRRVSRNWVMWGANHYADKLPAESTPCWIVWDKQNGNTDFADCELARTSFESAVRKVGYRWHGMIRCETEKRIHPNQKPVALYRWLLQNYAKPGDLILDTHVGSASSLIACEMEGHEYIGFELDADYYAAAQERLKRFRSQLTLNLTA